MPLIRFDQLPGDARLWAFAASRRLTPQEAAPFLAATDEFLVRWTAHKVPLATAREWRFDQFLFVAVDETAAGASGCSIDALVHFMGDAEKTLGVRLTDNGLVWYRNASAQVVATSRAEFHLLADTGAVGPDTVVFDNTIVTVGALREDKWEIPASRSWHSRAFFRTGAAT
ncbi:MAG: hypothetical protein EXR93_05075 [Gemmatimonadetes bacterium]|nr:hypothetical protein [Gemmatimonadota bacterium]